MNFNFQGIKVDVAENQLDNIEVKDPIIETEKPRNEFILIKENG